MDALQITWFGLFGVLVAGYAMLDGFDLGTGVLSLFSHEDSERRIFVNAIAPVWDGNEVWLLTAGGALFAAFPPVYATVFSAFYLALMLLLFALIARAVSMEFRGKVESMRWRRIWDLAFGLGSLVAALLFGVAVGNILLGLPLDSRGDYTGTFLALLHPYALVAGLHGLVMFTCHGAIYMAMKTDGELCERMCRWATRAWVGWVALFVVGASLTPIFAPDRLASFGSSALGYVDLAVLLAALVYIPIAVRARALGRAFLASSVAVVTQVFLVGLSLYPYLVPGRGAGPGLSVAGASSSERTLFAMLVIALVGMPLVIGYTVIIYRVFRGKVRITADSY
jgi:cytochrome d ubiquinol oxidase subunit II